MSDLKRKLDAESNTDAKRLKTGFLTHQDEERCGIIAYIGDSDQSPFFGLLKEKYSDFIVNEVDMTGKILHLNNQAIPEDIVS